LSVRKSTPLVSVVILNFNGACYIEQCLSSVLKTKYPNFEVILVDNASTDCSMSVVKKAFGTDKRLRIVQSDKNLGYSEGNNLGFRHSIGDYIVFLNNDTVVTSNWLLNLVQGMEADSTIGLAQSLIMTIDGTRIQTAGWLLSDYLVYQYPIMDNSEISSNFQSTFEVSFASGAAMIISRDLISKIGLFDSSTPFFQDDTLLSLKTWLADKRVVTLSRSIIYHIGGATKEWNPHFHTLHALRGKVCLLFDVYLNPIDLVKSACVFAISLLYDVTTYIQRKDFSSASASIEAISWTLKNFGHIWSRRINHWSAAKISSKMLIEKFIRIRMPISLYITRSKQSFSLYRQKIAEYERTLIIK
jgi:GT2 family glycosyltransferase